MASPNPASSSSPVEETHFPASQQEASATELILGCPCGQRLKVARSAAGKQVRCPVCSRLLHVPTTQSPTPPTQDVHATLATQNRHAIEETLQHGHGPVPTGASTTPHVSGSASTASALKRFGDYEILSEIARGGMGVVYKARQVSLNRVVALKMILSGQLSSRDAIERFQREARASATLDHPNIVPVYEVGEIDGQHFFSMGFVSGGSLQGLVQKGPLPPREAARLMRLTAEAVQHAHDHGVIHRDIKPHNVLMSDEGLPAASASDRSSTLTPKLTDFGLARIAEEGGLSVTGDVMGTPSYMPPEQARGELKEIGPPADIYSLGAVLYCLLTGRPPFQAATPMETMMLAVNQEPLSPRELNPHVPRDLETVCLKCLEKQQGRRYPTARALSEELGRYERGEPVQARPVGAMERTWRWSKRNPALAALFVTLLLGVIVSTWLYFVAEGARGKAEEQRLRADQKAKDEEQARLDEEIAKNQAKESAKTAKRNEEEAIRNKETAENTAKDLAKALQKVTAEKAKSDFVNYAFQFKHALDAVAQNRLLDARSILDSGKQQVARGWEDAYLRSLLTPQLVYNEHTSPVTCVSYSPDGKRIATGSASGEVRLWDPATGKPVLVVKHTPHAVRSLSFHPDGTRIVSSNGDATMTVWSTEDGKELLKISGHEGAVHCVAYSADGKQMVTGSADNTVRIWEATTGKELQNLKGHNSPVNGVVFSPDGKRLASASFVKESGFGGGILKIWNAQTGKELFQIGPGYTLASGTVRRGHRVEALDVKFSPDGKQIVSAASEANPRGDDFGQIYLWDAETGNELQRFDGSQGAVSVAFNSKGTHIVGGTRSGQVRMWDTRTGQVTMSCQAGSDVAFVGVSPDDSQIVTVCQKTVSLWDTRSKPRERTIKAHVATITGIALSRDGKRLVSSSEDTAVKLFDFPRGEGIWDFREKGTQVYAVGISPDGRYAASGNMNGEVTLRDLQTNLEIRTINVTAPNVIQLCAVVFHPDGTRIATGDAKKQLRLWDVKTGQLLRDLKGHPGYVLALAFSPDGTRIVSRDSEGTVKVWEESTGKELLSLSGEKSLVAAVAFSPDGKRIAAGGDKVARVWEASSGESKLTLSGHTDAIHALCFSPDGLRLATGSNDRTIKLWDVQTGEEALTIDRDCGGVKALAFSPDGRTLYSGNGDGTIRAFNPGSVTAPPGSTSKTPTFTFRGRTDLNQAGPVLSVAYSPDGNQILSGGGLTNINLRPSELWSWNTTTGAGFKWANPHRDGTRVLGIAYSPDNLWSVSVSEDSTVRIKHRRAMVDQRVLECKSPVCVEFSPDSNRLAVGTMNEVQVWEKKGVAFDGKAFLTLTGHTDQVLCVAYSPDDKLLASGSADRTIRVWDAQSGKFLHEIKDRPSAVTGLAFGPEGKLLSGHADGRVRIGDSMGKGEVVLSPFQDYVSRVQFSSDGTFMVASSWDGTVRGWNKKNAPVFHLNTQEGRVGSLAMSPDGAWLVTGQWNGLMHKWNLTALMAR